jgi:hypothetical protein
MMQQLNLFDASETADRLHGYVVLMHGPCSNCGAKAALIGTGKGPHAAELRCRNCDAHWQWISQDDYRRIAAFIAEISNKFGAPETISFRNFSARATPDCEASQP